MLNKNAYLDATGRNVKIAVVDDGIFPNHPYIKNVVGGRRFHYDEQQEIIEDSCWASECQFSHGTLCAGLISNRVPNAIIYSLRVIDSVEYGHPLSVAAAIRWAIEHRVDVLNLSIGMIGDEYKDELRMACIEAHTAGIILVAATHNRGITSYPSSFPEVISVGKDDRYQEYEFGYYPKRISEFVAHGTDQLVIDILNAFETKEKYRNISSSTSLAAPRITAIIAAIMEIMPDADQSSIIDELINQETKLKFSRQIEPTTIKNTQNTNQDISLINNAALYAFIDDAELIIKNLDQFPFNITCIVDPIRLNNTHLSTISNQRDNIDGIPILDSFDHVSPSTDTFIAFDTSILNRTTLIDHLHILLEWAVKNNKHVVNLSNDELNTYRVLKENANNKGLRLLSKSDIINDLINGSAELEHNIDAPVIAVLGTSFNQGKSSALLLLRRLLLSEGYEVSTVGTNPIVSLLKHGYYICQDTRSICYISGLQQPKYIDITMARSYEERPHIILVGGQGGIVPASPYSCLAPGNNNRPSDYTLPALSLLLAAKPDAVILAINDNDDTQYIKRSISVIESIANVPVIALVIDPLTVAENYLKYNQTHARSLTDEEIAYLKNMCTNEFNLPLIDIKSSSDHEYLKSIVINSFGSD